MAVTDYDFTRRKRVVMLTTDADIDRRILAEARSLQADGYEVILLALWDGKETCLYGQEDDIHIEKIAYGMGYVPPKAEDEEADPALAEMVVSLRGDAAANEEKARPKRKKTLPDKVLRFFDRKKAKASNKFVFYLYCFLLAVTLPVVQLPYRAYHYMRWVFSVLCNRVPYYASMAANGLRRLLGMEPITAYTAEGNLSHALRNTRQPQRALAILAHMRLIEQAYFFAAVKYRPDIIQVHDLPMLRTGAAVKAAMNGIPLVYDMHEFYPEQLSLSPKAQQELRAVEAEYTHSCDALITVNPLLMEEIKKAYNLPEIHVLQNATVWPAGFDPAQRYNLFREKLGIPEEDLILLYQGWFSNERNLPVMVEGLAQVHRPASLVMMGYGDYQYELAEMAEKHGVGDKVHFVPAVSQAELLFYTGSADVGVICYPITRDINTKYCSPNKLYEFIAAGLPTLSNDLPFVRSVLEPNGFGFVAPLTTAEEFGRAVDAITPEALAAAKANLRQKREAFMWGEEQKVLLNVFENLG